MSIVDAQQHKKQHGIHYTPSALAAHLSSRLLKYLPQRPGAIKLMDPAVGDGELLSALVAACNSRGIETLVDGYDTDVNAVAEAECRLRQVLPQKSVRIMSADFLDMAEKPTLFNEALNCSLADVIIANPPYIRTQMLGANRAQGIAQKFELSGRVDIYQAFIKAISWSLASGGIAALIVPNRFMTVRTGADIRAFILAHFDVLEIWDMGDTRLFEAAVLPAILILRRNQNASGSTQTIFHSVYRSAKDSDANERKVANVCDSLSKPGFASGLPELLNHLAC